MLPTFDQCVKRLMDAWITAGVEVNGSAVICRSVLEYLRPDVMLTVTDTSATDPLDWSFSFVRGYEVPSCFADRLALKSAQPFRAIPDRRFALDTLIAARERAITQARPEIGTIDARLLDVRIVGDRIILPGRNADQIAAWCVSLLHIRCLLPVAQVTPELDATSLAILQLLREGHTAKDIALRTDLSTRTIEHKLEKLKAGFGARSVAHLVTLSITSAVGRD